MIFSFLESIVINRRTADSFLFLNWRLFSVGLFFFFTDLIHSEKREGFRSCHFEVAALNKKKKKSTLTSFAAIVSFSSGTIGSRHKYNSTKLTFNTVSHGEHTILYSHSLWVSFAPSFLNRKKIKRLKGAWFDHHRYDNRCQCTRNSRLPIGHPFLEKINK